jgi:hypothetical protein
MKIKCDRAYAAFLQEMYRDILSISWQNGFMTIARLTRCMDLVGVCAE